MRIFTIFFISCIAFCLNTLQSAGQGIIYVDSARVDGANNGSSWADAYTSLQSAITDATGSDTIWVARGTYYPSHDINGSATTERTATFYINKNGLKIYGGFSGTETSLADRDIGSNLTVLSGDLGTKSNIGDNAYHVLYIDGVSSSGNITGATLLDGFTVKDGNANNISSGFNYRGGGCYLSGFGSGNECSPHFANCSFSNNNAGSPSAGHGAGVYCYGVSNGKSNPVFTDCIFLNNTSNSSGAAVVNNGSYSGESNSVFKNCIFSGNRANGYGGAVYNEATSGGNCSPSFTNCSFLGNWGSNGGAVFTNVSTGGFSNPVMTNCSFSGNIATVTDGGVIINNNFYGTCNLVIRNSVILGNSSGINNNAGASTITYNSLVQGLTSTSNGNISATGITASSIFVNPVAASSAPTTSGDYRLKSGGILINRGSDSLYEIADGNADNNSLLNDMDLRGNSRLYDSAIDIGAYEWQVSTDGHDILYVNKEVSGGAADGSSWADAMPELCDALEWVRTNGSTEPIHIWVAGGTYLPCYDQNGDGSPVDPRLVTFYINKDSVEIYGGFSGTESSLEERDIAANPTILNGDIGAAGDNSDNAYHVLYFDAIADDVNITSYTLFDGFSIRNGNANGSPGLNSNGGGAYLDGSGSGSICSPRFVNCNFLANNASGLGGVMYNNGDSGNSSPEIINCNFSGNSSGTEGGVMYNDGGFGVSSPVFTNCSFSGNRTGGESGVMYNYGEGGTSSPALRNCIALGNSSGIFNNSAGAILSYSMVQGDTSTTDGNIPATGVSADDVFQSPVSDASAPTTTGDYRLKKGSVIVNRGDNSLYEAADGNPTNSSLNNDRNLDDTPRLFNGTATDDKIDIGAYELQENSFTPGAGNILYVNKDVEGTDGSGSSWANAVPELCDVLDWVRSNGSSAPLQIWVAGGTYYPCYDRTGNPSPADARTVTFYLNRDSVMLYGSFEGTETSLAERNMVATPTILSGDIGLSGDNSDNAYHVLYIDATTAAGNITNATRINGFTIQDGKADAGSISGSRGGGGYLNGSGSGNICSPGFSNCSFLSNEAGATGVNGYGGAIYNDGFSGSSSPVFTNCSFRGNSATSYGGAMHNDGESGTSSPILINCSFSGNSAEGFGGALFNNGFAGISNPVLTNCSFSGNSGSSGGAMYNDGESGSSNPVLGNSIILGNSSGIANNAGAATVISYSLVQGETATGDGNISSEDITASTVFIGPVEAGSAPTIAGDYRLRSGAMVVNMGSNTIYEAADGDPGNNSLTGDLDLNAEARLNNSAIDMGAFELQENTLSPGPGNILYVDQNGTSTDDNGSSWSNAVTDLCEALEWVRVNGSSSAIQVWVAAGTYTPCYDMNGSSSPSDARRVTFYINKDSVQLYGGFAGTEGSLSDRDLTANVTVLSGDIGSGDEGDNAYHVFFIDATTDAGNITAATLVDGFTIRDGRADGGLFPDLYGGGCYLNGFGTGNVCSPRFSNCNFSGNSAGNFSINGYGGAMYNEGLLGTSSPEFFNCVFTDNNASNEGGAIYNNGYSGTASPVFTNCSFLGNNSDGFGGALFNFGLSGISSPVIATCIFAGNNANSGGAIYNYGESGISSPVLNNSAFFGNNANEGRAIYNYGESGTSSPVVTNCSFSGNRASLGGAMYNTGALSGASNSILRNTIILGNSSGIYNDNASPVFTYSLVQDETSTNDGNISAAGIAASDVFVAPLSFSAAPTISGDYSLISGSIVVDGGNDSLYEAADGDMANNSLTNDLDLSGELRMIGGSIDIGAFESSVPLPVQLLYFTAYKINESARLEWATASEQNNRGFDIERSGDAVNWKKIGFVATRAENGNSVAEITYGFTDGLPQAGTNFGNYIAL